MQTSNPSTVSAIDRFVKLPEVKKITALSRVSIWRKEKEGTFPKRYQIGKTAVAWKLSEIMTWLEGVQRAA